ncbi:OmpA/MotB family protein [Anaeromyxobacter paludicola]|uniref:Chemotaxis protein MotB n=1 Tax=Anaeromyxobacter paludicola TaxID=2918171 RepID=A0ABN6N812_9BACT|nr:OmpA family protein [Anaeromyxobacter paludicola]BDG08077.1 chemotaxis protein MotB [Anaeromyxobacter paludicola]
MAIKLSRPEREEDEDITSFWLITYSDMTTLLLAFFLLMFSFTLLTGSHQEELVQALNVVSANGKVVRQEPPREDLERAAREIAAQFKDEHTFVDATETEVTVGLSSNVTFASGEAALTDAGRAALLKAGAILARLPNAVRVEGHTDDVPMKSAEFPSNWHLSAGRAQSVVQLLVEAGVDARRLEVVGYGETRPRQPNATPEGRAANRRIELKLVRSESRGKPAAPR